MTYLLNRLRARVFIAAFYVAAALFNEPPDELRCEAARMPKECAEMVWGAFVERGLGFPDVEFPYYESFDGVVNVLWGREVGRPLPYPIDPTFGRKQP